MLQGTILHGTITDAETKASVPGAQVVLPGLGYSNLTSRDGRYAIGLLPPGHYHFFTRRLGYQQQHDTISIAPGLDSIRVDFALVATADGWQVWTQLAETRGACGSPDLERLAAWRVALPRSAAFWAAGRSERPRRLEDQQDCQRQVWRALYHAMDEDSLRAWLLQEKETIDWRVIVWAVVAWDDLRVVEFIAPSDSGEAFLRIVLGPEQRSVWRHYLR